VNCFEGYIRTLVAQCGHNKKKRNTKFKPKKQISK